MKYFLAFFAGGVEILMILKLILAISLVLSPIQVLGVDEPLTCGLCPGYGCDND